MPTTDALYERARLYDLAFSYRDITHECDALVALATTCGAGPPRRVLELASGPGRHAQHLAAQGIEATILDRSAAMLEYGQELASVAGIAMSTVLGDIRSFRIEDKRSDHSPPPLRAFDLIFMMLDSASHLLRMAEMVSHLHAVEQHLAPGGVYITELAFPSGTGTSRTRDTWSIQVTEGECIDVVWGQPADRRASKQPITTVTVEIQHTGPTGVVRLRDKLRLRQWSRAAVERAVNRVAGLEVAGVYGDFGPALGRADPQPFSDAAWRMIFVLRRSL